jgi:hypothetical protein
VARPLTTSPPIPATVQERLVVTPARKPNIAGSYREVPTENGPEDTSAEHEAVSVSYVVEPRGSFPFGKRKGPGELRQGVGPLIEVRAPHMHLPRDEWRRESGAGHRRRCHYALFKGSKNLRQRLDGSGSGRVWRGAL